MIEEIDLLQEKLNSRTDALNALKNRRNELNQKLDETETHLKQVVPNQIRFLSIFLPNIRSILSASYWTQVMLY